MSSEEKKAEIFNTLSQVDVSSYVKEKNGLSYLAWTFAWAEVKKRYPDATYKVWKDENHRPYIHDPDLGYMCFTSVTIQGETEEMWLPVMDGANKAQKNKPYTYKVTDWEETNAKRRTEEKAGMDPRKAKKIVLLKDKSVDAATMFDINTTVMRCFVKNLAMFGMGHYIYAGESIPESLINVDELIEDASVALKACTDGESVVALWSENKAIQKEDKFLTIYIAAAGSILDKCTTATSLPKAWNLFSNSIGTNDEFRALFSAAQARVSAIKKSPEKTTTKEPEKEEPKKEELKKEESKKEKPKKAPAKKKAAAKKSVEPKLAVDELIKMAIEDIGEHSGVMDLVAVWNNSAIAHDNEEFVNDYRAEAIKYLEGCTAYDHVISQWGVFKDSLGQDQIYVDAIKEHRDRVGVPKK